MITENNFQKAIDLLNEWPSKVAHRATSVEHASEAEDRREGAVAARNSGTATAHGVGGACE